MITGSEAGTGNGQNGFRARGRAGARAIRALAALPVDAELGPLRPGGRAGILHEHRDRLDHPIPKALTIDVERVPAVRSPEDCARIVAQLHVGVIVREHFGVVPGGIAWTVTLAARPMVSTVLAEAFLGQHAGGIIVAGGVTGRIIDALERAVGVHGFGVKRLAIMV